MSQFPSQALESGAAPGSPQQDTAPRTPRLGVTGELAVPGIVPRPPVSREANRLERLKNALDATAGAISAGIGLQLQVDEQVKGAAIQHAKEIEPFIHDDIDKDRITPLSNIDQNVTSVDQAISKSIDVIIEERTSSLSDVGRKAFSDYMRPRLSASFANQRARRQNTIMKDGMADLLVTSSQARTSQDISNIFNEARDLGISERDIKYGIIIPGMGLASQDLVNGESVIKNLRQSLDMNDPTDKQAFDLAVSELANNRAADIEARKNQATTHFTESYNRALAQNNIGLAQQLAKDATTNPMVKSKKVVEAQGAISSAKKKLDDQIRDNFKNGLSQQINLSIKEGRSFTETIVNIRQGVIASDAMETHEIDDVIEDRVKEFIRNVSGNPRGEQLFDEAATVLRSLPGINVDEVDNFIRVEKAKLDEAISTFKGSDSILKNYYEGQTLPFPLDQRSRNDSVDKMLRDDQQPSQIAGFFSERGQPIPQRLVNHMVDRLGSGDLSTPMGAIMQVRKTLGMPEAQRLANRTGDHAIKTSTTAAALDIFPASRHQRILDVMSSNQADALLQQAQTLIQGTDNDTRNTIEDDLTPMDINAAISDITFGSVDDLGFEHRALFNRLFRYNAVDMATQTGTTSLFALGAERKPQISPLVEQIRKKTAKDFGNHYVRVVVPDEIEFGSFFIPSMSKSVLAPARLLGIGTLTNTDNRAMQTFIGELAMVKSRDLKVGGVWMPERPIESSLVPGGVAIPLVEDGQVVGFAGWQRDSMQAFPIAKHDEKTGPLFARLKAKFDQGFKPVDLQAVDRAAWNPSYRARSIDELSGKLRSNVLEELERRAANKFFTSENRVPDFNSIGDDLKFNMLVVDEAEIAGWPNGMGMSRSQVEQVIQQKHRTSNQ